MRPSALPEWESARIIRTCCCTGCFLPESVGVQLVPLWNIAGPHTGKLKPGPLQGPVFYWARRSAKARDGDVVRAPRLHAIVRVEIYWENVRRFLLTGKVLSGIVRRCPPWARGIICLSRGRVILGGSAKPAFTNTPAITKKSSGENSQNRLGNRPVRQPLQ